MTILIVDDNRKIRTFLREIVSDLGYDVAEAEDGESALRQFDPESTFFVLMDIRMTGMDGITAVRELRKMSKSVTIFMVTDFNEPILKHAAITAGANDYILKDNLFELITKLTNSHRINII